MSGSVLAPWAYQVNPRANARILANNLRCFDYDASSLLQCLQVNDILAFHIKSSGKIAVHLC